MSVFDVLSATGLHSSIELLGGDGLVLRQSGPAALAVAQAGLPAVGLNLEPDLLRLAAARAREGGLADRVRFVVGDAMALPFPRNAFDVFTSTFGVMFAPVPGQAASELVGWGDSAHVHAWFGSLPAAVRTQMRDVRVAYPSVEHAVRAFENMPGPLRAHRAALRAAGRWDRARAALAALFHANNQADDGSLLLSVPYLLIPGGSPGRVVRWRERAQGAPVSPGAP